MSLVLSLLLHAGAIVLLSNVSITGPVSNRPVYEELVRPYEAKIIYYPVPKKVSETRPEARVGTTPEPRALVKSPQTVIASAKSPKSVKQIIWQPAPKFEIPEDLPLPLAVARTPSALPPPPKPEPRKFVPPPPSPRDPKLPIRTQVMETDAPTVAASPNSVAQQRWPAFSNLAPPPKDPPAESTGTGGDAVVDLAIASLDSPSKPVTQVPNGARSGQFSRAPVIGAPSSGELAGSGAVVVPNLTVHEPPKPEAPKAPEIVYSERVRTNTTSTFSVPLRPSNRMIPPSIENLFRGRSVYTIVIPIENLPAYSGDWIVWFAEKSPAASQATPLMRAPVPLKKVEPVVPARQKTETRIQLTALLSQTGKLRDVKVLSTSSEVVASMAVQDLSAWEFRPATRNNTPVDVDIVVEIPFYLPLAR